MPKKKRPSEKPEEQFERFLKVAERLQIDEKRAEQAFEVLGLEQGNREAAVKNPSQSSRS